MTRGGGGPDRDPTAGPTVPPLPPVPPVRSLARNPGRWAEGPDDGSAGVDDAPRTRGDAGMWLLMAGGGFVVGQVLSGLTLVVIASINGHSADLSRLISEAVPPAWVVIGGLAGLWVGFLGAVVLASRTRGTRRVLDDMGLSFRRSDPIIGVAAGLFGQFVLVWILYLPWEHLDPNLAKELDEPAKHLTGGFPGVDLVVIGVLTVLIVPVVEELFFRGLVLRALVRVFGGAGRLLGPLLAIVVTGIVFGLAHGELLELLGLAAFGVVLSALAYFSRRLGPSIFAHATFNLAAILDIAHQSGWVH
ncbi:MAG: lysostaphin resistance A-like protein [Acidimicrobiales bacterium]